VRSTLALYYKAINGGPIFSDLEEIMTTGEDPAFSF
jgi:hypothetical protein